MDAGHDSAPTTFGQRFAQMLAALEAATSATLADLVAAMPIVMLVRAAREALSTQPGRKRPSQRQRVDAG